MVVVVVTCQNRPEGGKLPFVSERCILFRTCDNNCCPLINIIRFAVIAIFELSDRATVSPARLPGTLSKKRKSAAAAAAGAESRVQRRGTVGFADRKNRVTTVDVING